METLWDLTPLEVTAIDVLSVMASLAPLTESEVLRLRRVKEQLAILIDRIRGGWSLEEACRQADRIPFSVKLQKGRWPALTVGKIRMEIAWRGLPRPVPSEARIREALALLCERGFVRRERRGAKGGRRVYRFLRLPASLATLKPLLQGFPKPPDRELRTVRALRRRAGQVRGPPVGSGPEEAEEERRRVEEEIF